MRIERYSLAYFPVPKVACTSVLAFLHEVDTGRPPSADADNGLDSHVHHLYPTKPFAEWDLSAVEGDFKFCVMRDPVARIRSCYTSKVFPGMYVRDPDKRKRVEDASLPIAPTFDEFVDNLEGYRAANNIVRHHSQPLSHFLGRDPAVFDAIYGIKDMDALVDDVAARTGTDLKMRRLNKTRDQRRAKVTVTDANRDAINTHYAEDHAIFGAYFAT